MPELDARQAERRKTMWSIAGLDEPEDLLKPGPPPAQGLRKSVFAAVRPVTGEGTPFTFTVGGFTVPRGLDFFFFGSLVGFTFGARRAGLWGPGPLPASLCSGRTDGVFEPLSPHPAGPRLVHDAVAVRTGLPDQRVYNRRVRELHGKRCLTFRPPQNLQRGISSRLTSRL